MSFKGQLDERLSHLTDGWESVEEGSPKRKRERTIHDAVHGAIKVDAPVVCLLDSPPIQRLREIRQLGTADKLYPTANHSRFEHSLGVFHVATDILSRIQNKEIDEVDISESQSYETKISALLHDVGHLPFSHTSELFFRYSTKFKSQFGELEDKFREASVHEFLGFKLLEKEYFENKIESISDEYGYSIRPKKVRNKIIGDEINPHYQFLADLINGPIDIDKLDYLLRDTYQTGFPNIVDAERFYQTVTPSKDPESPEDEIILGIERKGIRAAESLFIARDRLKPSIYNHHLSRVTEEMLIRKIDLAFDNPIDLIGLTDRDVFCKLNREFGDEFSKYRFRKLPKRYEFFTTEDKETREKIYNISLNDLKQAEETLGERFNKPFLIAPPISAEKREKSKIGRVFVKGPDEEVKVSLSRDYERKTRLEEEKRIMVFSNWRKLTENPSPEEREKVKDILCEEFDLDHEMLQSKEFKSKTYNGFSI